MAKSCPKKEERGSLSGCSEGAQSRLGAIANTDSRRVRSYPLNCAQTANIYSEARIGSEWRELHREL